MTEFDDMYGSKFFNASNLEDGPIKARITRVEVAEFTNKEGIKNRKFVVSLSGQEKKLPLIKTNAETLALALGKDQSLWINTAIELFSIPTQMGPGVRIKILPRKPAPKPEPDPVPAWDVADDDIT